MAIPPTPANVQRGNPADAGAGPNQGNAPATGADGKTPTGKRRVEVIEVGPGAKFGGFGSPFGGGIFGNGAQRAAGGNNALLGGFGNRGRGQQIEIQDAQPRGQAGAQ